MSVALISAGLLLRPLISELWHWYFFHALVFAGMPGATVLASGKVVGMWFPITRGRMMGVVTAGNNFGGLTMVPLAALVLAIAGWEWAYLTFGIIMALVAVAALLIIPGPAGRRGGRGAADRQAEHAHRRGEVGRPDRTDPETGHEDPQLHTWVTLGLTAASFTYQGILTQIVPHLENEGFSTTAAAAALTLVAAMGIGSKLSFGRLSESISARRAAVISVAFQAIGVGLMIAPGGSLVLWSGVFVFGLGYGGLGAMIVLSVSEAFGLYAFGAIMGMVNPRNDRVNGGRAPAYRGALRRHRELRRAVRHHHWHLRVRHGGASGNQAAGANADPRTGRCQRIGRLTVRHAATHHRP